MKNKITESSQANQRVQNELNKKEKIKIQKSTTDYFKANTNFLKVYDCLLWYFGPRNENSALVMSFLLNLENYESKKEYYNGELTCTAPYIELRLPLSSHAISAIMKKLSDDDLIKTKIYYQRRKLMINTAKVAAIEHVHEKYISALKGAYKDYDFDLTNNLLQKQVYDKYISYVDEEYKLCKLNTQYMYVKYNNYNNK